MTRSGCDRHIIAMDRYGSPKCTETCHYHLGGGLKHLLFSSLFVQMIQFDFRIFFRWVESNHQLVIHIVHTQKEWKCTIVLHDISNGQSFPSFCNPARALEVAYPTPGDYERKNFTYDWVGFLPGLSGKLVETWFVQIFKRLMEEIRLTTTWDDYPPQN